MTIAIGTDRSPIIWPHKWYDQISIPFPPISADSSTVISPADSPIPAYSIQQSSVQEPLNDLADEYDLQLKTNFF